MEKIDIIGQEVYCYSEFLEKIKTLELRQFTDIDFSFLDGSELYTFNLTQPIKRSIKFTKIDPMSSLAEFTENLYSEMTEEEQATFDSIFEQATDL